MAAILIQPIGDRLIEQYPNPRVERISYSSDVARRFAVLVDRPWAMWLDSGYPEGGGRYDICVADPRKTIVSRDGRLHVWEDGKGNHIPDADPYQYLRSQLVPYVKKPKIPFLGGLVGYFGYDHGRRAEGLPVGPGFDEWPEMAFGLFDWALVTDHLARRTWLVTHDSAQVSEACWSELVKLFEHPLELPRARKPKLSGGLRSNVEPEEYAAAFARIKKYILDGDCYQVNLAQRFSAEVEGDPWSAYRYLREINPAPYAAFLNLPFGQVLSSSPEQFLSVEQGTVTTRPIKGTRPRGDTRQDDERLRVELRLSLKDRAENLMIVDLLRNDLGKVCRPGNVTVPQLFEIESFASVHHLVSTVRGLLRPDKDMFDLLRGSFPGGSITGAPKRRAMEIIDELEPDKRGIYCGSIAWLGHDATMNSNIAIRTMTWSGNRVSYAAGGGIVVDSEADAEFEETLDKAAAFFRLFENGST